jgi:hypothetical protein
VVLDRVAVLAWRESYRDSGAVAASAFRAASGALRDFISLWDELHARVAEPGARAARPADEILDSQDECMFIIL